MKQAALAAAIGVALGAMAPACAGSSAGSSAFLLGDWDGERTRLADQGVTFNLGYGSQLAHNSAGGTDRLTRYSDQWVLGTELDLHKLWGWQGATLVANITDRNGRNLSTDAALGTFQQVQEVYGRGQTWRLTSLYLTQSLLDGRLLLKGGRLNIGSDFAAFSCDFQNLTFCGSQPGNLVGSYWANWPVSVWAGVARFNTGSHSYVQLGAYQVNPHYVEDGYNVRKGLYPNFPDGTTGALIPLEFGYTPSAAFHGLPGSYKIGAWYNTSDSADLLLDRQRQPLGANANNALQRDGAYGAYLNFRQQVSGVAGGEGASVFLNVTQADRFSAATDRQVAVGLQYQGVFDRPADSIGVALGATHANGRRANAQRALASTLVNDGDELAAEVYYGWAPMASVVLRPNLQYIVHPGATGQNDNAVVVGLKTSIAF